MCVCVECLSREFRFASLGIASDRFGSVCVHFLRVPRVPEEHGKNRLRIQEELKNWKLQQQQLLAPNNDCALIKARAFNFIFYATLKSQPAAAAAAAAHTLTHTGTPDPCLPACSPGFYFGCDSTLEPTIFQHFAL